MGGRVKICVINYAPTNAWFPHGQERLKESLRRINFQGDILLFNNENFPCITHREIPYAFKFHVLREVQKRNYELVLWVDASFWAIRNIDDLFQTIYEKKFVVQDSGYPLGQWTSNNCLERMGVSREEAFGMLMFSGGMMGYNFHDKQTFDFFEEFYKYAEEGHCFKGPWRRERGFVSKDKRVLGHRHDMSVGSILMLKYGFTMFPNNTFFNYYAWHQKYKTEMDLSQVYFVIEGGPRELPLKEIQ